MGDAGFFKCPLCFRRVLYPSTRIYRVISLYMYLFLGVIGLQDRLCFNAILCILQHSFNRYAFQWLKHLDSAWASVILEYEALGFDVDYRFLFALASGIFDLLKSRPISKYEVTVRLGLSVCWSVGRSLGRSDGFCLAGHVARSRAWFFSQRAWHPFHW